MTRKDLTKALSLAISDYELPPYLSLSMFEGCSLHNKRIFATLEQFAGFVRGHAVTFGGSFDPEGMTDIESLYKRVDLVREGL